MEVVKLTEQGARRRVLDGKAGMTFVVDSFGGVGNKCAHVRDYRYQGCDNSKPWQIWTLGEGDYETIPGFTPVQEEV